MEGEPLVEPEASHAKAPAPPPPLIIKADELDTTGTDVSTPVPDVSTPITPALEAPQGQPASSLSGQPLSSSPRAVPVRPILRREGSTPAPPLQPPPPAPPQQEQQPSTDSGPQPTDSLSLLQLRQLVTQFPKLEPQAYAYDHADTRSFAEEVDEWYPYSEEEKYMLVRGKEAFEKLWKRKRKGNEVRWTGTTEEERRAFVYDLVKDVERQDGTVVGVESLAYIAMGCWGETAGLREGDDQVGKENVKETPGAPLLDEYSQSTVQIKWMSKGCELLAKCRAVQCLFDTLRRTCDSEQESDQATDGASSNEGRRTSGTLRTFIAMNQALTALYLLVEVGRCGPTETMLEVRHVIADLEPNLLKYLTEVLAKTRWQDSSRLPFIRLLLLYWKVLLLVFGSSDDLEHSKEVLRDKSDSKDKDNEGFITASPLDYHLFRQEITSKYPAYNPPPPLIPIEIENNTILPPLPNHPSRQMSQENLVLPNGPSAKDTPGSIFNQPVHIATPAPSPPPSPAGPGGKGGKKQNYQTNQNFPFLYPPPDATGTGVGNKDGNALQSQIQQKRWEGSDVPASILEAGQLFASRMRMSRSIRQLWDVRERFIRHERGWNEVPEDRASSSSSGSMIEEDDSDKAESDEVAAEVPPEDDVSTNEPETQDEEVQARLDTIEEFYHNVLPHLQSVVLVLWKVIFTNVSHLVAQANGTNAPGLSNGISFGEDNPGASPVKRRMNISSATVDGLANGHPSDLDDGSDPVIEELNNVRLREISSKAIAAIFILLLKWFKLSHILKFEYMTQLLLDANYVPLILKLFAHQDIDRAVDQKNDRQDL
ncbi:MAG: hypothetical protein Q9183_004504, partial [Haloplaca sp. 2 TL-2023]